MDVYSFLATSPSPVISSNDQTIAEVINTSKADSNGGSLNNEVASHVICLLSQKIDRYKYDCLSVHEGISDLFLVSKL